MVGAPLFRPTLGLKMRAGSRMADFQRGKKRMYAWANSQQITSVARGSSLVAADPMAIERLTWRHEPEALAFLAERSIHTFGLAGFIRNNGIVSPHNRGEFYGCRDEEGVLLGVALIGHFILFETRSDRAIEAFAKLAQGCFDAHMLLGEQEKTQTFWEHYADGGQAPRLFCRELLMEQRWPAQARRTVQNLRLATPKTLIWLFPHTLRLLSMKAASIPSKKTLRVFVSVAPAASNRGAHGCWLTAAS